MVFLKEKRDHFINIGTKEVCNISILKSLSWKEQIYIINPDIFTIKIDFVHSQKWEDGESSRIT